MTDFEELLELARSWGTPSVCIRMEAAAIERMNRVQCMGIDKETGERCKKKLTMNNKLGYCVQHREQSPARKKSNKERVDKYRSENREKVNHSARLAARIRHLKMSKEEKEEYNRKQGEVARARRADPIKGERVRSYHREYAKKWHKTPAGINHRLAQANSGDLNMCKEEANIDADGNKLCIYSNRIARFDGKVGKGRANADHIDSELKGTAQDGPHNWILTVSEINSSKSDRCLFEWHNKMKDKLQLRPLGDILADFVRLGKRIPPRRGANETPGSTA